MSYWHKEALTGFIQAGAEIFLYFSLSLFLSHLLGWVKNRAKAYSPCAPKYQETGMALLKKIFKYTFIYFYSDLWMR